MSVAIARRNTWIPGEGAARTWAALLAVMVHIGLVITLLLQVAWKKDPPRVLSAELVTRMPAPLSKPVLPVASTKAEPPPKVDPVPAPKPEPKAEPAKPAPSIAKVEAPADIARKQAEEKKQLEAKKVKERQATLKEQLQREERDQAKQRERGAEAAREEKRVAELKAMQNSADTDRKLAKEALDRETRRLAQEKTARDKADQDRAAAERAASEQAAKLANARGLEQDRGAYITRIQGKVRGNLVYSDEAAGNPSAQFEVQQLPTGEVVNVTLRRSSGVKAYDDAIERAIRKSSPLPKPEAVELFERNLVMNFRLRE